MSEQDKHEGGFITSLPPPDHESQVLLLGWKLVPLLDRLAQGQPVDRT